MARGTLKNITIGVVAIFALIGLAFSAVFVGMHFGLFNVRGSITERNQFFKPDPTAWERAPEWATVRAALQKDEVVVNRVAAETGVPARLIVAAVIPEQLRFFTSERELYKQIFEPLKILGSLSQFSLGISGIKEETAAAIEARATTDEQKLFVYPAGALHDTELFNRLTDEHNHYYSYLYTALYIKEIEREWATAGYPIDQHPGIVTTLFNIGFENSHPNAHPAIGGAAITINGATYLFGEIGESFYTSNQLIDVFFK